MGASGGSGSGGGGAGRSCGSGGGGGGSGMGAVCRSWFAFAVPGVMNNTALHGGSSMLETWECSNSRSGSTSSGTLSISSRDSVPSPSVSILIKMDLSRGTWARRDNIGIMEKNIETTIVYWGYM